MTHELHRPVKTALIGPTGLDITVQADPAECAALAQRMGIPGVLALSCRFRLEPTGDDRFLAHGHLLARVVRTCVVSLEDFETDMDEAFRICFVPAGEETDEVDPESDDEIPFGNGLIDLGEATAEQLALTLDPYPRMPEASLPEDDADAPASPFARLAAWRRH
jgi:uncharacterized metal-binding protein YceD (DUF177 family)